MIRRVPLPFPMNQPFSIVPSPELVQEWIYTDEGGPNVISRIATHAVQWGADQELEACCLWLNGGSKIDYDTAALLRAARRPKPPSLKESALNALEHILRHSQTDHGANTIRRALEALDD